MEEKSSTFAEGTSWNMGRERREQLCLLSGDEALFFSGRTGNETLGQKCRPREAFSILNDAHWERGSENPGAGHQGRLWWWEKTKKVGKKGEREGQKEREKGRERGRERTHRE